MKTPKLSRHPQQAVVWIVIGLVALACNSLQPPTSTRGGFATTVSPLTHSSTPPWTVTPASGAEPDVTPDVRTRAPQTVEVILSAAADSPSQVFFTLWKGDVDFFMVNLYPGQQQIIYLLPGEYRYSANAPIPTQPLGCYNITESYGWGKDDSFIVDKERIEIQAKLGFILIMCTPTPGG